MKTVAQKPNSKVTLKPRRFRSNNGVYSAIRSVSAIPSHQPIIQHKSGCPCGGGCPRCKEEAFLQAKLKIGAPNDKYEQEADRVAAQVMRMPEGEVGEVSKGAAEIQRKCAACESGEGRCTKCAEEEEIQRKLFTPTITPLLQLQHEELEEEKMMQARGSPIHTTENRPDLAANINAMRDGGSPLPHSVRSYFEPRFGADFSQVRVHSDARVARMANSLNARAFTIGRHIGFNRGEFCPDTASGKHLLGHELTHTIQQAGAQTQGSAIQRSQKEVTCSNEDPFIVDGEVIDDPVGLITKAERWAVEKLDVAIEKLDIIRKRMLTRERTIKGPWRIPRLFPLVDDAVRLMGMNPRNKDVWLTTGPGTVALLLERLRAIRGTIGVGLFKYTCLPELFFTFCGRTSSNVCDSLHAEAFTCAGEFHIVLCEPFWKHKDVIVEGSTIIHEAAHNYYVDMIDVGDVNNAECYSLLVQILNDEYADQPRWDLCPRPNVSYGR